MATAKKTSFSDGFRTIGGLAAALAQVRQDGATDDASAFMFPAGDAYTLKAEWSVEVADPAEPAADTREQPTQYATGGVVEGSVPVLVHQGEALVQPDGLVNDTPGAH